MPKLKLILTLFIALLINQQINAVVIVVHGSFSTSSCWHSTQGAFFQMLETTAAALKHPVITFNWSGIPTYTEIKKSGHMLAKLINSYPKYEKIILVGHSHGGNVINIASQNLYDVVAETCDQISKISHLDMQKVVKQEPLEILPKNKTTIGFDFTTTTRKIKASEESSQTTTYKIDAVYLLGTPVDHQNYVPQMKVIKHLFNFYSTGDGVQSVGGLYDKLYQSQKRITNIELKIRNPKTNLDFSPSHRQTHHSIVGGWLLLIPFALKEEKIGGFEKFEFEKNCTIVFRENDFPIYHT